MDKRRVCDLALQALAEIGSSVPCYKMALEDGGWCEKHCRPEFQGAQAECWREYLERKGKDGQTAG